MVTKMPESQNTEWKSKWKDEYLEWICGYANAQGGKIYIGCDDEGNVVGLPNARKLLEDIPNKIRDAMGIIVGVNLLDEDGKEYIEIDVPPYPIGISCKGVYYYRSGSTRQILTGPALEAFLMRKRGATWDNLPLPAFSLDDVDDETVAHFKQWAAKKGRIDRSVLDEPKDVLMEKLHLMNGPYLTNAAMLLFSKDPEKWQLGAYVKIGYFETDSDLLYQDEIHGSILEQIDKIVELVYLKYMRAKITYEGMQRIERYFVPEEALREALLNALCHKQYQSGVPIQISVYEDKLYIANCGCLPENWTLENFYLHDRFPTDCSTVKTITTGTYNTRLNYRITYKTNYNDYRVLATNLLSTNNYAFDLTAVSLMQGEVITDVRLEFGKVPAGFASVVKPTVTIQTSGSLANGYQVVNRADAGGQYMSQWETGRAAWITIILKLNQPNLPKTGY